MFPVIIFGSLNQGQLFPSHFVETPRGPIYMDNMLGKDQE